MKNYLFTSESVTEGHPDKVSDQISDAILDAILKQDSEARVACETMITTARVIVSAEITTTANIDYKNIIKQTLNEIGYTNNDLGADSELEIETYWITKDLRPGRIDENWLNVILKKSKS